MDSNLPTFLLISKHSPENCPSFNEKAKDTFINAFDKSEELAAKHDVKMVGSWTIPTEHVYYIIFDAPSLEAFNDFGMEPDILAMAAFHITEVKIVTNLEEKVKKLKNN